MTKAVIFNNEEDNEVPEIVKAKPINKVDLIFQVVGYSFVIFLAAFTYIKTSEDKRTKQSYEENKAKILLYCSFYDSDNQLTCLKKYSASKFTNELALEFNKKYERFMTSPTSLIDDMKEEKITFNKNEKAMTSAIANQSKKILEENNNNKIDKNDDVPEIIR